MTTLGLADDTLCSAESQLAASELSDDSTSDVSADSSSELSVDSTDESSDTVSASMRFSAQWYPDVPTEKLCLNEEFFPGTDIASKRQKPLISLLFGGCNGVDLSKLIALSVWIVIGEALTGIEFEYCDCPEHNRRIETFEHCEAVSFGYFRHMDVYRDGYEADAFNEDFSPSEKITFKINGHGGEIISGIDWEQAPGRVHPYLYGLKVS